jgi:hypothetical protein
MKKHRLALAGAALCALSYQAHASCGAAFCLVNTDWSVQGEYVESGARFDLRYEFIDLDQPRNGRDRVAVGQIPRHHDEVETRNNNVVGSVDWALAPRWGLSLAIPFVDRDHRHIHNHQGEQLVETWSFRELGDARAQARYEVFASRDDPAKPRSAGLTFGFKLPTGKYDVTNSEGEEAERTLQPGTGTTDFIAGAYWHAGRPLEGISWFGQAQVVAPLNSRAGYKPGKQLQLDGGVRYAVTRDVGLMAQLNYHAKGRDSGVNAEPDDSGQRAVYVSPGISWNVGKNTQLYAFAQVPIYQSVNGVQLTADWSAAAGVSWRFQ